MSHKPHRNKNRRRFSNRIALTPASLTVRIVPATRQNAEGERKHERERSDRVGRGKRGVRTLSMIGRPRCGSFRRSVCRPAIFFVNPELFDSRGWVVYYPIAVDSIPPVARPKDLSTPARSSPVQGKIDPLLKLFIANRIIRIRMGGVWVATGRFPSPFRLPAFAVAGSISRSISADKPLFLDSHHRAGPFAFTQRSGLRLKYDTNDPQQFI